MSVPLTIGLVIALVIFAVLWRKGHLMRFADYVRETREELRKCTWPTRTELKAHTIVVAISIALLGAFTVLIDLVVANFIRWII